MSYLIKALESLKIDPARIEDMDKNDDWENISIDPRYKKLLLQWRNRLQSFNGPSLKLSETQNLFAESKEDQFIQKLIERCGENLSKVLLGSINPLELLFPNGSFEILEKVYRDSAIARYFNSIVVDLISQIVEEIPPGKLIRILEIGAGTGGTTSWVSSEITKR